MWAGTWSQAHERQLDSHGWGNVECIPGLQEAGLAPDVVEGFYQNSGPGYDDEEKRSTWG